jgi:hypothetical protein
VSARCPSKVAELRGRLAPGTAKLRDRLSVWIVNSCGGGQVSSGSGGVGGADAVSYPTTTPCTPTATSRSTRPGQAASARLSGPGSLTVALPTPWSRPIGRRNGTTPRLGCSQRSPGYLCLECGAVGVDHLRRRRPAGQGCAGSASSHKAAWMDAGSRTGAGSTTLRTWMSSPKPQHRPTGGQLLQVDIAHGLPTPLVGPGDWG